MAELYGDHWILLFLIGVLVTWGIGLTPPFLIRFLIVRQPLGRGVAFGATALLWIFNFTLFTAMGSKPSQQGALLLVAFASYYILRKEAKGQRYPFIVKSQVHSSKSVESTGEEAASKVPRLEVKLMRQKPEIMAMAKDLCGGDPTCIEKEYIRLRAEQLQEWRRGGDVGQSSAPAPPSGSAKSSGVNIPLNKVALQCIAYAIGALFLVWIVFFDPAAPKTRADCVKNYVLASKTNAASRILMASCRRQFSGERVNRDFEDCLMDSLPNLANDAAVTISVRSCRDQYRQIQVLDLPD